jgi:hypothetical protein
MDMDIYTEEIHHKESRIKIITDQKALIKEALKELITLRNIIENHIRKDPYFQIALEPFSYNEDVHELITCMMDGAQVASVGPMAAVAGTIAEYICRRLMEKKAAIAVVENGGDIFAYTEVPIVVGLFSGSENLGNRLAFELGKENTPLAICSSSSLLGHSLSFGRCSLVTVFSKKGCIADAVATAACNRIHDETDIQKTLEWACALQGVDGIIIHKNDKIGMIGTIPKLVTGENSTITEKITKDQRYIL